jgi:hypothetical protein
LTITNNVVNLFASPEFARLSEGLLSVCRGHPAARADIVALLRSLDAKPATDLQGSLKGPSRSDATPMLTAGAGGLPRTSGAVIEHEGSVDAA